MKVSFAVLIIKSWEGEREPGKEVKRMVHPFHPSPSLPRSFENRRKGSNLKHSMLEKVLA